MTEKHKIETINTDQKFQHLVENSLQGIVIIKDFRIVYSNPAFANITGYSVEELLTLKPKELTNLVHPDEQTKILENLKNRIAGINIPPHYKVKGMTKDGKPKILDLYASIIEYDGGPATLALILDITDQFEAEEKLKQRTKLVETIVNSISLGIAVKEIDSGNYAFINKEVRFILGLNENDYLDIERILKKGKNLSNQKNNLTDLIKTDTGHQAQENLFWENIEILTKAGEKKYISAKKIPLEDQNLVIYTIQDITDRIKSEKFLKSSLAEKEILLREIHHRVKNNLQTISSLLDLQAESITEPTIIEAFRSSQNRIKSMALIHERLYKSENLSKIKAEEYIEKLIDYLEGTYHFPSWDIEITTDIKSLFLNIDIAIPCGLIINELVSNSIKYAFPKNRKGRISVSLQPDDMDNLNLTIKDNGIGIPLAMDTLNSQSLGLQLVNLLVKQLNGTMDIDGTNGTTVRIVFPKPDTTITFDNKK